MVNKLTLPATPNEVQNKINEIIDSGGGGGGGSYTAGDGIDITNNVISVDGVQTTETTLATVATSGAYSDLSGKPTVDQTYNSTSPNAQSGVAIAGVLGDIETLLHNLNSGS